MTTDPDRARALVDRLLAHPELLPFPAQRPRLVETHISWVLLCGDDVLKFKKPVRIGFIDYSTLARRDRFAREELRLNRRLSPELYLGVLAITGTPEAPRFDGVGPLLEPAVHMRQFDPEGALDVELAAGRLSVGDMVGVGEAIAAFQAAAPRTEAADPWGRFDAVLAPVRENFRRITEVTGDLPGLAPRLEALEAHGEALGERLATTFAGRRAGGFVREGHGDLHLGNLARTAWGIRAFDALEFAPALRWLDVVSDLAFLVMDLRVRDRPDLAWTLVDAWATRTGDHDGLRLLPFYTLYRTLVRVKVAALQRDQRSAPAERARLEDELQRYLRFAEAEAADGRSRLVLMHGLSGSGKSRAAAALLGMLGAVRLRSDVERKRLYGHAPEDRTPPGAIYGPEADALTDRHLLDRARDLLRAGLPVIVDATHLRRARRAPWVALARRLGVPCHVVSCSASPAVLRDRVRTRAEDGNDPSEADVAVLEAQLAHQEPILDDEGFTSRQVLRTDPGDAGEPGPGGRTGNADPGAVETSDPARVAKLIVAADSVTPDP